MRRRGNPETGRDQEFSPEERERLLEWEKVFAHIAGAVAGKEIRFKRDKPGTGGWRILPHTGEMAYDPREVLDRERDGQREFCLGAAAHEGSHGAISDFRLVNQNHYNEPGYKSVLALVEELPTDHYVRRNRDDFGEWGDWVDYVRRTQVEEGDDAMEVTPEERYGYPPVFNDLHGAILYKSTVPSQAYGLEYETRMAFARMRGDLDEIENMLPPVGAPQAQALAIARRRYQRIYDRIWPEVKFFWEQQRDREMMRQVSIQILKEAVDAREAVAAGHAPSVTSFFDDLPENLQYELTKHIYEAEVRKIHGAEDRAGRYYAAEKPTEYREDEVLEELGASDIHQEGARGLVADALLDEIWSRADRVGGEREIPVPVHQFSYPLKKALERRKDEIERRNNELFEMLKKWVEQILKELDEETAKKFRAVMGISTQPGSGEGIEVPGSGPEDGHTAELDPIEEAEQWELKELYEDEIFQPIQHAQERLYRRLEELFRPNTRKRTQLRMTGTKPNLRQVFKRKAAQMGGSREAARRIPVFERRDTPQKRDYKFAFVLDGSSSMFEDPYEGEAPLIESLKALALAAEVLNRLGIGFSLTVFSTSHRVLKSFEDPWDDAMRSEMAKIFTTGASQSRREDLGISDDDFKRRAKSYGLDYDDYYNSRERVLGGNTAMTPAIKAAGSGLSQVSGARKIMTVLADGGPNNGDTAAEAVREQQGIDVIGIGIGSGTSGLREIIPRSATEIDIDQIEDSLVELLESVFFNLPFNDENEA